MPDDHPDDKEPIVHSTRVAPRLALIAVCIAAACGRQDPQDRDTAADTTGASTDTGQSASCLPVVPEVRGSLVGQRELAQREARRVRVVGDGVARVDSGGGNVTISPACGSHAFRAEDLARGQFVARLAIDGRAPRFSRFENDTVYWWVYLDLTSGRPVLHSQYLSTAATSDAGRSYLRRADFVIRCKPAGERPRTEVAAWESPHDAEACPETDEQMRMLMRAQLDSGTQGGGSSPWFGCTLGCCQSSRFFLDEQ